MKVLYEINDVMEDELKQLARKEQLTKEDICLIGEMVDVVKDIVTIEAMRKAEESGYSNSYVKEYSRGYPEEYANMYGSYNYSYDGRRGRDNDSDGRYSETGSYARGRDSMGRYTSRDDGYSRHSKEEMIDHLKQMMMNARTPEERENYRATIEQMSK